MAKFYNPSKFTKSEQEEVVLLLCEAISHLKSPLEIAEFLKDILSIQEIEMVARRFKIAELLVEGLNYNQISVITKASPNTISRVNEWLKISGTGYRMVLKRMPKKTQKPKDDSWRQLKRRYPLYFWPQLVLEAIVESAKENEKRKLRAVLKSMDEKSDLYKRLNELLCGSKRNPRISI